MDIVVTLTYIVGALLTHCYIYRECKVEDIEHESANIMSILWPVALVIYIVLKIEEKIKVLFSHENNKE